MFQGKIKIGSVNRMFRCRSGTRGARIGKQQSEYNGQQENIICKKWRQFYSVLNRICRYVLVSRAVEALYLIQYAVGEAESEEGTFGYSCETIQSIIRVKARKLAIKL